MTDEPRLERNDAKSRYELWVGETRVGTLTIRDEPDAMVLVHTRTYPQFEGHGYGGRLVSGALAEARRAGRKVRLECEFAQAYVKRHPAEQDLVLRD
jgi:uncharacterized protein